MYSPEMIQQEKTIIRKAELADIPSIKELLEKNLGSALSDVEREGGFLTWNPDAGELESVIRDSGIYLSIQGGHLKGYLITMSKALGHSNSFFSEMIRYAESMEFDGKHIEEYAYVIFAQICIAKEFRGGMTFTRLHFAAQSALKDTYDIWIGEIADMNHKSLAMHSNYFDAGTYVSAENTKWHVIVGDLRDE